MRRLTSWRADPAWARPVLYLDTLAAQAVAEQLGLQLISPPLDWLCGLPEPYRRREVRSLRWGEAAAEPGPAFFKPADDKWFPAGVYPSGAEIEAPPEYDPEAPLLRSEIVRFLVEFRCFVSDRRVRTCSVYLREGELASDWQSEETETAAAFAQRVLDDPAVDFPRAAVLDVGRTEQHGWLVVEANPAWAAGLYGCDPAAALDVLAETVSYF